MSRKKRSPRRLVLQKVDVLSVNARTQTRVVLALDEQHFVGRVSVCPDDEELIRSTALATLDAVQHALPPGVSFMLKNAAKLRPPFLDDPLYVAIVDCHYQDLDLSLTGACIASNEKTLVGIASAVLDATNRLVRFLLGNN
ncbi:MAG: hypothetical protein AB1489_26590 [Acidobacteriota bacterium]